MAHIPVLQKEVMKYLEPKPNENFIDATIGGGGHSLAILEKTGPKGRLLGIDSDLDQIKNCKLKIKNLEKRIILACDNFANLKEIVKRTKFGQISGILFDLGMSSWHLEESGRGFSYRVSEGSEGSEPLDMRYSSSNPLTAEKLLNFWSESEIARILQEFGEERFSRSIAKEIVKERKVRPIISTLQLVKVIQRAVPLRYQHQKIHFATRTFQALRIAVNQELENLSRALPQTIDILEPGGRIVVISFHSLEDRIVKNFLREKSKENSINILTKKPIRPSHQEIIINARARSARLRAAEKL